MRNEARVPALTTATPHGARRPKRSGQVSKDMKGIEAGKEGAKLSWFADRILYIGNPQKFTKKLKTNKRRCRI